MVRCKTILGKETRDVLAELSLSLPKNKKKRIIGTVLLFCLAAIILFFDVCGFLSEGMTTRVVLVGLCGIGFLAFAFCVKPYQRMRLNRILEKSEKTPHGDRGGKEREYVFSQDNVKIKSNVGESTYSWDAFVSYTDSGNYICLTLFNASFVLVDKSGLTAEELEELSGLLRQNITGTKTEAAFADYNG